MEQKKMINLKKEILDYLSTKKYMSLRRIANRIKIEPCFVADEIKEMPEITKCGRYFDTSANELGDYYTVHGEAVNQECTDGEHIKQIQRMVKEVEAEIKQHNGIKTSAMNAYNMLKNCNPKPTVAFFLLSKMDTIYCYEIALGIRNLAHNQGVKENYLIAREKF